MLKIFRTFLLLFTVASVAAVLSCIVIEPAAAAFEAHHEECADAEHDDACCHVHHIAIPSDTTSLQVVLISTQGIISEDSSFPVGISADIFRPPRG